MECHSSYFAGLLLMCLCFMCILHDALVKTKKLKEIEEREQNEVVNAQSRTITLINLKFFDSAKSKCKYLFLDCRSKFNSTK